MLVHLPGAFRAAQIFGAVYDVAPLSQRYAMELMALAVDRDVSYRHKELEDLRRDLEPSRQWIRDTLGRVPWDFGRWLPQPVRLFLENRRASEILVPPARITEPPVSPRTPIQQPTRLPLVSWREKDLQPLLGEWNAQVAGLQRLMDLQPPGEIRDPELLSAAYFYDVARGALRLAYFDELTGLRNRHELERLTPILEANLQRKRKNAPADYFLMVDIDHFKNVNDTHGHPVGDIVLQKIAKALFHVREGDYVFRLGGEEFLLFMANVGERGIGRVAQRIRRQISELKISAPGLEEPLRVTVSIGVTRFRVLSLSDLSVPDLPKTPVSRAIEETDQALYRAKKRGRNRVVYYWKK
ncbi:MAG TPA: GGDEF domain-containing protein [bacterium]|nr:GGDEF domain-containing protein [bacterium]